MAVPIANVIKSPLRLTVNSIAKGGSVFTVNLDTEAA
jgi:hypothetical protein